MYPSRSEAESLLYEAETCNPGTWGDHSRTAAHCAACIARHCGLDPEKAYVLGLLTILDGVLANDIWAMWWTGLSI